MQTEIRKASLGGSLFLGLAALVLAGILTWAWLHFSGTQETYDQGRSKVRSTKLEELKREDQKMLTNYGWTSKEKGIVRLPIEQGLELVLNELKAKPVQASSVQVESPYPAGLQPPPAQANASAAPAPETKQ